MWLAASAVAVVGIGFGFLLATWLLRRRVPVPAQVTGARASGADTTPAESPQEGVSSSLREAVDHLEVGVVVISPTRAVRFRNAAARRFHGTHVGVLVDDHVAAIVGETAGGARTSRLVELHGPPKAWLEISADPIPDGGAVVTIRDVTERVRTDTVRTDFVTNISHELKTPVGAVAVLAEALADESDPAIVHRLSDRLVEEAHRAVHTIDDLLKLSQIESTRPGDDIVELDAVIQRAVGRGQAVGEGRDIAISILDANLVGTPAPLLVRGDELQLESAIGNLVENAVKYSHDGGRVQVRLRVDDTAVEVMVADQGIGIPTRDLDRVFERFYRVDKARSRETGGTGLGLSIVRHVATNHGGDVLVSSQEGEGSTFVLRLPATLIVTSSSSDHDSERPSTAQETTRNE